MSYNANSRRLLFYDNYEGYIIKDAEGKIPDTPVPASLGKLLANICHEHMEMTDELTEQGRHNPLSKLRKLIEYIQENPDIDTELMIKCVESAYKME